MANMMYTNGRDRHIIIVDNTTVIKVAKNNNGLEQNHNEYMLNKKRPDITATVQFYAGEYLVMDRVTIIENKNDPMHSSYKKQWKYVFDELQKEIGDSLDNDQIGIDSNGRVVAYDYGHTEEFVRRTILNSNVMSTDSFQEEIETSINELTQEVVE